MIFPRKFRSTAAGSGVADWAGCSLVRDVFVGGFVRSGVSRSRIELEGRVLLRACLAIVDEDENFEATDIFEVIEAASSTSPSSSITSPCKLIVGCFTSCN